MFKLIEHVIDSDNDIQIIPLGDVHIGSSEFNAKAFKDCVNYILNTKDTYTILIGDLCDTALKNSKSDIYKSSMSIMEQQQLAVKLLKPLANAGKILGMTSGNHENRISREVGLDAMHMIAEALGIEDRYSPEIGFLKIKLNPNKKSHLNRPTYTLVYTHGVGGGTTYSFLNRNTNFGMCLDGADVLITGHTHKPAVIAPSKIRIDTVHNGISVQPFYCITTKSWLEYGGYAAEKMLLPSSDKGQVLILDGKEKNIKVVMG